MKLNHRIVATTLATIVSGALSGYFLFSKDTPNQFVATDLFGFYFGPGIFFGLTIAILCLWIYKLTSSVWRLLGCVLWVGVSVLAWYTALSIVISNLGDNLGVLYMMGAGIVGATILALSFWLLIKRISLSRILIVISLGGILGGVVFSLTQGEVFPSSVVYSYMLAFIVWQVGVGVSLIGPSAKNKNS